MDNPLVAGIVVVAAASFSVSSQADFLGVYAGASVWDSAVSGQAQDGDTTIDVVDDLGTEKETSSFYYIAFEHPVPVLPNIRLQQSDVSVSAVSSLDRSIDFDGITYDVGETVASYADLSHTDATMYWEVVDLVAELDLGVTARLYDGVFELDSDLSGVSREEFDAPVPMLFAKLGFKIPLTGVSASVSANAMDYSDYQLFDATARVNYEAKFGLGVEAGYRIMELDIDDEDIQANLTTDGFYAGLSYHF